MRLCFDSGKSCESGRLVPHIGPVRDTKPPVAKTPQYRKFPLYGVPIMAVTMDTDQQFPVTIQIVDRKGKPAATDGVPVWLSDNTDVLALAPSADGLTCDVMAVGIPGTAKVQVTADADLGSGVEALVGVLDVSVTPAPAVAITMTPGTVVDQP